MASKKTKIVLLTKGDKSLEVTEKAFKSSSALYAAEGYHPATEKQVITHTGATPEGKAKIQD